MLQALRKRFCLLEQIVQSLLFIILLSLLGWVLITVHDISGTSRVVNYAGIVRGATQRIIKLEISGRPTNELIEYVEGILTDLKDGGGQYELVALPDRSFQASLGEQTRYWSALKVDIYRAREIGWENTELINDSELYFSICDKTVSLAEGYAEQLAGALRSGEEAILLVMLILGVITIVRAVEAAQTLQRNQILHQKAYYDAGTHVRNRYFFEEFFPEMIKSNERYVFCYVDLDGLKYVNDTFGHAEGDRYIETALSCIKRQIRSMDEIFRLGGDEFALFMPGCSGEVATRLLNAALNALATTCCMPYPASFSYGIVSVEAHDAPKSVEALLAEGDALMYRFKTEHKKNRKDV